jgi:hypothetical protein
MIVLFSEMSQKWGKGEVSVVYLAGDPYRKSEEGTHGIPSQPHKNDHQSQFSWN